MVVSDETALKVLAGIYIKSQGVFPESWVGMYAHFPAKFYSIYDQNLLSLLRYLWPVQRFDTPFMTVASDALALNIGYKGRLWTVLLITMKK